MRLTLFTFLVVLMVPSLGQSDDIEKSAIETVRRLAGKIEQCPRREVVARFGKRWVKEAWGPPASVEFDVERSRSVVRPYTGIVTFSLVIAAGPDRKTREDAEADATLKPIAITRYRNLYGVGAEVVVLSSIEVTGPNSEWGPRPAWPDACWDHLGSVN